MVAVGPNLFYTVTLPCTLWFFDKSKSRSSRREEAQTKSWKHDEPTDIHAGSQCQRRAFKPAWGVAPCIKPQTSKGLKTRPIAPPCAIHHPITENARWVNRALGAWGKCGGHDSWGYAPGWYEPGLWPTISVMPQSLNLVVVDFLCIHPFRDGNGRVLRLLTLLAFYHHGYEVGRYISLERLVEQSKEDYYEVLNTRSIRRRQAASDLAWITPNTPPKYCGSSRVRSVSLPGYPLHFRCAASVEKGSSAGRWAGQGARMTGRTSSAHARWLP